MRALLTTAFLLVLAAPAAARPADPPAAERPAAQVSAGTLVRSYVDLRPRFRGPRIPRSFLGLSIEYTQLERFLGATVPNPPLVALLRRLGRGGAGAPVIRAGGATTELAWAGPEGQPNPPGVHVRLTPGFLSRLGAELRDARARAIMGINVAYPGSRLHVDEALAMVEHMGAGRLLALELGNEPGFYAGRPYYTRRDGTTVPLRPRGWGPSEYLDEIRRVSRAIRAAGVRVPQAGPATDYQVPWVRAIGRVVRALGPALGMVSVHDYPLTACDVRGGADPPSKLLEDGPRVGSANRVREMVERARAVRRGIPVRVTETNSASCGGIDGASDAFAASLWGLDHLFTMAAVRTRGVNFHTASERYQPFQVYREPDGRALLQVKPLFYAMQVFAEAARNRPRLIPTTYFAQRSRPGAAIRTWGLHDRRAREIRIVTVYKRGPAAGSVDLKVPRGARRATLRRLTAASVAAREGISWAGRTFPRVTTDGAMVGTERTQPVRRRRGSRYRFRMTPGSASVLSVRLR